MDWVAATAAAMEKWMRTTEEGLHYASNIFKFKLKKGEQSKEYLLVDNQIKNTFSLKSTQVWFYEGCLVDGHPIPLVKNREENFIPPIELEISDLAKNKCDGCGIVSHCTQEVLEPSADELLTMCNFCLTFHESPRVKDKGGYDRCVECDSMRCVHHPR